MGDVTGHVWLYFEKWWQAVRHETFYHHVILQLYFWPL